MTEVFTHHDVYSYLCDIQELNGARGERLVRSAIRNAYRDLPNRHKWSYLKRRGLIVTSAQYETGTVVYDHTGGSSERLVTLSGGTFPSWAEYGSLKIGEVSYKVESRVSSTTLTLEASSNPGEDVASTAYTLYRALYPLPNGFHRIGSLIDLNLQAELDPVTPEDILSLETAESTPGDPYRWAIRGIGIEYPGQMGIELWPAPSTERSYAFSYDNVCRELVLPPLVSGGSVAITSGSTAVTGTTTAFPANCAGAMFRVSYGSQLPDGLHGENPYRFQSRIQTRVSATSLTLEDAPTESLSGVNYVISDPIDIEPGAMYGYFLNLCEYELARLLRLDPKMQANAKAIADIALRDGVAADGRNTHARQTDSIVTARDLPWWDRANVE